MKGVVKRAYQERIRHAFELDGARLGNDDLEELISFLDHYEDWYKGRSWGEGWRATSDAWDATAGDPESWETHWTRWTCLEEPGLRIETDAYSRQFGEYHAVEESRKVGDILYALRAQEHEDKKPLAPKAHGERRA